ncbi:MAG: hypothetical protein IJD58_03350 [Lachnospiraceae bacterium]|nr:hypothetical protein [Lachnospiraceae bacterium]
MSDRDKKLLIGLLIAVILGGSWWLSGKLKTENESLSKELNELQIRYTDLDTKNGQSATYKKNTETNTTEFNKAMSDYNTSLSQEQLLMFYTAVEKSTGVWLNQMSLNSVSEIYTFGKIGSSNPSKRGQRVYDTDNIGITTTSNVSYQCTYDQLKDVLTYLRDNGKKVTVNSISYSYAAGTDMVSGTMALSFFAIKGSDRPPMNTDVKDVFVGTDNIFNSETFTPNGADASYKDKIITDYDLYLIVNRTGADKDAVICGQSGDMTNQTVVSSNSGVIENVTITVTGTEGNYKVSYQVGSKQYPAENFAEGAPLVCGDTLDLLIISSERGTDSDTSEINLFIKNQSDMVLNAAIINDNPDPELSRIHLQTMEGAVTFYE